MSDRELELAITEILRTMKQAMRNSRVDLIPELQGKLTQCISEYMVS